MSHPHPWNGITHNKASPKHTCRSCPSVPYIAPSTPWESRHTTQLSTVRCSGRRQKFSMQVLMPYTKNEESGNQQLTQISKCPRLSQSVFASCYFILKRLVREPCGYIQPLFQKGCKAEHCNHLQTVFKKLVLQSPFEPT